MDDPFQNGFSVDYNNTMNLYHPKSDPNDKDQEARTIVTLHVVTHDFI